MFFPYIVDISLDRGDENFFLQRAGLTRGGHFLLYDLERFAGSCGGIEELRKEELSLFKCGAYPVEGRDQMLIDDGHLVLIFEQRRGGAYSLLLQSLFDGVIDQIGKAAV